MSIPPLRQTLAQHLGQVLTPEIAVAIEVAASLPAPPVDNSHNPAKFEAQHYRGYVFAVESLRAIRDEIHPLHEAHFEETEKHRLGFGLQMNYDFLDRCELDGRLLQFTARKDGALVGNIRMFLSVSLHTGTWVAAEDTFFMRPEHRRGFLAIRFWQYMEQCVQAIGVREIRTDSKLLNKVDRLNVYCGYTPVATKFVKIFQE